jgi:hypothetical protein
MANLNSDDLFKLIKSLTGGEKRFFKIYVSRYSAGKKNNYLRVFDAIDAQKEYNEDKLLNTQRYIVKLPLVKTRLYKLLLESLESFSGKIEYEIRSMLNQADFLLKKGLLEQQEKLLDKTLQLARDYYKYEYIAEINQLQIFKASTSDITDMNKINNSWLSKEQAIKNTMNAGIYAKLNSQLFSYRKKIGMYVHKKNLTEINALMSLPLLKNEKNAFTPLAKSYFHLIHES